MESKRYLSLTRSSRLPLPADPHRTFRVRRRWTKKIAAVFQRADTIHWRMTRNTHTAGLVAYCRQKSKGCVLQVIRCLAHIIHLFPRNLNLRVVQGLRSLSTSIARQPLCFEEMSKKQENTTGFQAELVRKEGTAELRDRKRF